MSDGQRPDFVARKFFDEFQPPCLIVTEKLDQFFATIDPKYQATIPGLHCRAEWVKRVRRWAVRRIMRQYPYTPFTVRYDGDGLWRAYLVEEAIRVGLVVKQLQQTIDWANRQESLFYEVAPKEGPLEEQRLTQLYVFTLKTLENCALMARSALELFEQSVPKLPPAEEDNQ